MTKRNVKHFESLFRQLQPRLFAYCCKYVEDEELARDIVQECFINLWENYGSVKIAFEHYLIVAVRNRCISHFRSLQIRSEYADSVYLKIKSAEFHSGIPDPLSDIYTKELYDLLRKNMATLPEKCRQIFEMSRFQGMRNQEIADSLGISVRTVESQIYYALRTLKSRLKDYLPLIFLLIF